MEQQVITPLDSLFIPLSFFFFLLTVKKSAAFPRPKFFDSDQYDATLKTTLKKLKTPIDRAAYLHAELLLHVNQFAASNASAPLSEFYHKIESEMDAFGKLAKKANNEAQQCLVAFYEACHSAAPLRFGCVTMPLLSVFRRMMNVFAALIDHHDTEKENGGGEDSDSDAASRNSSYDTVKQWMVHGQEEARSTPAEFSFGDLIAAMRNCEFQALATSSVTLPDYTLVGSSESQKEDVSPCKRARSSVSN